MAIQTPGDRSHLERLLTDWSKETEYVTAGRLRNVVGVTVIAQMLDEVRADDGSHLFVFKGGAALQMRYGLRSRATKDLDAAYRGDLGLVTDQIKASAETGWAGFDGVVRNVEEIVGAQVRPLPLRMKLQLRYKNRAFMTMPLEISAGEGRSADEPEIAPVAITLGRVQLAGPSELPFLPLRYQIAQKLHACSEPSTEEHTNDRVRDLVDLDLIEQLSVTEADLPAINAACKEIFSLRNMHSWPPEIVAAPGWEVLWERLAEDERLDMTLDEALAAANKLIRHIAAAA
jgi:Nucleotidyl transferase AbiEii toxin, Type IV TA system